MIFSALNALAAATAIFTTPAPPTPEIDCVAEAGCTITPPPGGGEGKYLSCPSQAAYDAYTACWNREHPNNPVEPTKYPGTQTPVE